MLKEINTTKKYVQKISLPLIVFFYFSHSVYMDSTFSSSIRAKEIEARLLTACQEDLLRIAEYEKAEEDQEEGISTEQQ